MKLLCLTALLIATVLFSWGFVNVNSTLPYLAVSRELITQHPQLAALIYGLIICGLFIFYAAYLKRPPSMKLLALIIVILFFSYPAFSYDIFNYLATAKVTFFWRENPYLVMPIEIAHEPLLTFMHAANKTALYGPFWILLTFFPWLLGLNNLLLSFFTFKVFITLHYLGIIWLIWKTTPVPDPSQDRGRYGVSNYKKEVLNKKMWSVMFFALNPLVLIETLISGHNDVVMMFWAMFSFYLLQKKQIVVSLLCLLTSILVKYATLVLLPFWLWVYWSKAKAKIVNQKKIYLTAAILMFLPFFASPLREEIYAWYWIWPLSFLALIPKPIFWHYLAWGFSFGLLWRFMPFLWTGSWAGSTPLVKKLVTFLPPIVTSSWYWLIKLKKSK